VSNPDIEQIFTRIYDNNDWCGDESRSGPGSSALQTQLLRPRLAGLFSRLDIRSLLDLPCGDFNWMRLMELSSVDYTGGDIVRDVVQQNVVRYACPGRRFVLMDMLRDPLPKADLILCRDCLVHFSFSDIAVAIRSMKRSGSTYLLATTFVSDVKNEDSPTGGWRPLNLGLPPFCFPDPQEVLLDGPRQDGSYPDKALGLYRLDALPRRIRGIEPAAWRILVQRLSRRQVRK
jgi:hypothetical protein